MYTKEQCIRLAKIQYYFFGKLRKFFRILLSVIPLIVGVIVGLDSIRGILLLVLGIYVYVKTASIYEIDGEKAYNSIKQNTAPFEYDFFENEFRVRLGEKEKTINYNSIYALVRDEEYIYLFLSEKRLGILSNTNKSDKLLEETTHCFISSFRFFFGWPF